MENKSSQGEKMDSWLRHSVLRTALRASVGAARLGMNLRPLPPEDSRVVISNRWNHYFGLREKSLVVERGNFSGIATIE